MKKSKWFDGSKFVPAHVGVYEVVNYGSPKRFQYWNGLFWGFRGLNIDYVEDMKNQKSIWQSPTWRGIKK